MAKLIQKLNGLAVKKRQMDFEWCKRNTCLPVIETSQPNPATTEAALEQNWDAS